MQTPGDDIAATSLCLSAITDTARTLCLSPITDASSIAKSFKSSSIKFPSTRELIKQLNTASALWNWLTECSKTSVMFLLYHQVWPRMLKSGVTNCCMFKASVTSSDSSSFIPSLTNKLNNNMLLRFATASLLLQYSHFYFVLLHFPWQQHTISVCAVQLS